MMFREEHCTAINNGNYDYVKRLSQPARIEYREQCTPIAGVRIKEVNKCTKINQ